VNLKQFLNQPEDEFQEELITMTERVAEAMTRIKSSQKICPRINQCDYIANRLDTDGCFTIDRAKGYVAVICKKYPSACELNRDFPEINNGT